MLTVLSGIVAVLLGLLFAWFLFLVLLENLGPFVLAMLLVFKFIVSCVIALIRLPFRSREESGPA